MRIATWNVNGIRARLDFVLQWLEERKPDVIGLQELKSSEDQLPAEAIERAGYQILSHGQKSWNGVAILVRKPLTAELRQRGLPGQEDFGARLISADVEGLSFTSVYVPNGKDLEHDDFSRKLAWLDALAEHFQAHHDPAHPTVLCGDFNVVPDALDSWNPEKLAGKIFHTDAERSRLEQLRQWGLVDLFRARYPDTQAFSWWDYRGGAFHRGQGLRIDFLLGTPAVLERAKAVEIDRDWRKKKDGLTPSDHVPVVADLEDSHAG